MIDQDLRKLHLDLISEEGSRKIYDALCDVCDKRDTGLDSASQQMIGDYAALEQMKQELYVDVLRRGVSPEFRNGRQVMKVQNKSIPQARQIMEQQRKLLSELRLTPASNKAVEIPLNDEFAKF